MILLLRQDAVVLPLSLVTGHAVGMFQIISALPSFLLPLPPPASSPSPFNNFIFALFSGFLISWGYYRVNAVTVSMHTRDVSPPFHASSPCL